MKNFLFDIGQIILFLLPFIVIGIALVIICVVFLMFMSHVAW